MSIFDFFMAGLVLVISFWFSRVVIFSTLQSLADNPLASFKKNLWIARIIAVIPVFNLMLAGMIYSFRNQMEYQFLYSLVYAREYSMEREMYQRWGNMDKLSQ